MSIARDALRVLRGSTAAQLLQFGLLPVLTRLADPGAFGTLALFVGVGAVLSLVSSLRYDIGIVVARSERQAQALAKLVRLLGGLFVIVTMIVSQGCLLYIVDLEWRRALAITGLLSLFIFTATEYKIAIARLTRTGLFGWLGSTHLVAAAATTLSQLGLLSSGVEPPLALMAGYVAGQFLATLACVAAPWKGSRSRKLHVGRRQLLAVARRFSEYPRYALAFGLLMQCRDRALHLVISAFAGTTALGVFTIAQRVTSAPYNLMHGAMGPAMLSYARMGSQDAVARTAAAALEASYVLFVPLLVALASNATELAPLLFGSAWAEAGALMPWLAAPYLLLACGAFLDRLFVYYGQQRAALVLECGCAMGLLAAVVLGGLEGSVLAMTISFSIVYAIYLTVWIFLSFKLNNLPVRHLKCVSWNVLWATTVALAVNLSLAPIESVIIRTVCAAMVGVVIFVVYMRFLFGAQKLALLFGPGESASGSAARA